MKYIDADRLRAEIEELEGLEYPCDNSEQNVGFGNALDRVSDIIDSLQQEQMEVDFASEIEAASKRYPEVSYAKLSRIAKRFYELGKNSK